MDSIAPSPSATIGQVAKFIQMLERDGIAGPEIQRFIDDLEYRAAVVLAFKPDDAALIEMPEEFNVVAMQLLLKGFFPYDWKEWKRGSSRWLETWDDNPFEILARTDKVKAMMRGLTHMQQAVVVLRTGLSDGTIISADEAAEQLGITTKQLNKLRGDASRVMKQRASQMGREKRRATLAAAREASFKAVSEDSPIEALRLTPRQYNALKQGGVDTVAQLVTMTRQDLLDIRNMGVHNIQAVEQALAAYGLSIREA